MIPLPLVLALAAAAPVTIDGTVYVDVNENGLLDVGEPPAAGVKVWLDDVDVATSDANGRYAFTFSGDGKRIVWARTPDGYKPTPVWKGVVAADGARTVDLGLRPSTASGNVTFVHASDSHINNGISVTDVQRAFQLAVDVEPRPHFLVVTGDITQDSSAAAFQTVVDVMAGLDVPFVPVIGNHDEYDGRVQYTSTFGPAQYCFDQGGMRFVVLDLELLSNEVELGRLGAFIDRCVVDRGGMKVAAFIHWPPSDHAAAVIADHGVDYLFTGHWHANRIIEHGTLEEVNTQTFVMGGIDFTPAGYRVVSFDGDKLGYRQHTIVEDTVLSVMWPPAQGCVAPGDLDATVAAEAGMTMGPVTVSLDGGAPVTTVEAGGWDRTAKLSVAEGQHTLVASGPNGATTTRPFCATSAPTGSPQIGEWTQLQGQASHVGVAAQPIDPPLEELWARPVGGSLRGGSVVVAGGRVFVPVVDLAGNSAGGVVALDARTGALLWEHRTGYSVPNAPAVVGDLVIFGAADGVVHALDTSDGSEEWSYDLGQGLERGVSWLYAAPTVADGVVYIGVARRFAALEAASGRELWRADPSPSSSWLPSYAAAGVGGGIVVVAPCRGADPIVALDELDGHEVWRLEDGHGIGVNSGILVDDDRVYLGNSNAFAFAVDIGGPTTTTATLWDSELHDGADSWSYGIFGTPALAGDRLIVGTMFGSVVALDKSSGSEIWRFNGQPPIIRPSHYRGSGQAAFAGSPVVAGSLVWIGGVDGRLSALALDSGDEWFAIDLGAPILDGVVAAGDLLFVGTFDGTVHAFWHPVGLTCPGAPGCVEPPADGCTVASDATHSWTDALWILAVLLLIRRR